MFRNQFFFALASIALLSGCSTRLKQKCSIISLDEVHAQLIESSKKGDVERVALLLKVPGIDPNCRDARLEKTPLMHAAKRGHVDVVCLLLNGRLTPEQINSGELLLDRTALMFALNKGHVDVVKLIADRLPADKLITYDRADTSSTSEYACNTQMRMLLFSYMTKENFDPRLAADAAFYNDIALIKDMIKKGFALELLNTNKMSLVLHRAAMGGNRKIVAMLIEAGADKDLIMKKDGTGKNALMWAALDGHHEIVSLLLKQGLSIEQVSCPTSWGETALMMACKQGHREVVSLLLEWGISSEHILLSDKEYNDGYYNNTAIEHAAIRGHKEVVELLLSVLDNAIEHPFAFQAIAAAAKNDTVSLQALLDDPSISLSELMKPDFHGRTAFIIAAQEGHFDVVSQLLQAGITHEHISAQDCNGKTALHWACDSYKRWNYKKECEIVDVIVASGISTDCINLPDNEGWTPLMFAASWKHTNKVNSLLQSGLTSEQINAQNASGETALMWAIKYLNKEEYHKDNTEIVHAILSRLSPEQLNVKDWEQQTVLFYAAYDDQIDILALLLSRLTSEQILQQNYEGKTALDMGYRSKEVIQEHLDMLSALPEELFYQGLPISNAIMSEFLCLGGPGPLVVGINLDEYAEREKKGEITDPNLNGDTFSWKYIDTIDKKYYVIEAYASFQEGRGTFSTIAVVSREGVCLKVIDYIHNKDQLDSMIRRIQQRSKYDVKESLKNPQNLPKDLMYKGSPISDTSMHAVFGLGGSGYRVPGGLNLRKLEAEEEDIFDYCEKFKWKYIGSINNKYHVVYGYDWPKDAMGKFSGIFVLKREKNNLIVIDDSVGGGDRHSTMVKGGSLEKNQLTYSVNMTDGSLIDHIVFYYPELKSLFDAKNNGKVHYGEGDSIGVAQLVAEITTEGRVVDRNIISFHSAHREYQMTGSVEEPVSESLGMGDAIRTAVDLYCSKKRSLDLTGNELKDIFTQAMYYTEKRI